MPEGVKAFESVVFPARVTRHDTKASTKDGVGILKVGFELSCTVGAEEIKTRVEAAFRSAPQNGRDWAETFPLDDDFEIVVRPRKK